METHESNRLSFLVSSDSTDTGSYKPRRRPRSIIVEVEEIPKKEQRCTRFEKFLILVVALMLIFCVVLLCLYLDERQRNQLLAGQDAKVTDNTTRISYKTSKMWSKLCWTPGCMQTSSELLSSIDPTVNPCEDFYLYACGGWIKQNPRPGDNPKWDQFSKLTEENNMLMKRLVNSKEVRAMYYKDEAIMKALVYYDSCMDKTEIERLKGQPLKQLIKEYGSWAVIDKTWNESNWDFMSNFVKAHAYLAVSPLFSVWVDLDIKNSSINVINMDQSYLGISHNAFVKNSSSYRKMRIAYKELMINLTKTLGGDNDSVADMEEIYKFEKELSKILIPYSIQSNTKNMYKKMSLRKLQAFTGRQIDWVDFLQRMFAGADYKITEDEKVVVYCLDYLVKLFKFIARTPKRLMSNYIMWRMVKMQYVQLSKEYTKIFKNYYIRAFNYWRDSSREEICLDNLSQHFGMPVSRLYLDRRFNGESKALAKEIVDNIRKVFVEKLRQNTWMDNTTKQAAKAKAESLLENVGYPEYVMNKKYLASLYKKVPVNRKKYFMNEIHIRMGDNLRNLAKLGKPVDKTEWPFPPTMLNAYYSYNENKMVFPAAMLQAPFYNAKYPRAVNYGAIGTIMAHELTHGFDVTGKDYNKDGNLLKWWTDSTIKNFHNKSQCLIDQYSNYTFYGNKVDGKLTLSENIADNGGIKQAFQAYKTWIQKNGEEPRLPGMMLSNEQVFFLGFAMNWCGKFSPLAARLSLRWDEHAPMSWRVNGSLRNFKEFAKSFNCPLGSSMNPKKKCEIW